MSDREFKRHRWLNAVNPSFKLLVIAMLFIIYLAVHDLNTMLWAALLFSFIYLSMSGFSRGLALMLFVLSVVLALLSTTAMVCFGQGMHILFEFGLIRISRESLGRGMLLGLRTLTFAVISLVFASTTEPVPFFYSLMQQLRLPARYAYGFLAAFRLLPMMAGEFVTLRQAMKVRGLAEKKGPKAFYARMRRYSLTMLAQAIRRAQRTAVAMAAKRFSLTGKRTYYYSIGWSGRDIEFVLIILGTVVLAFWLGTFAPLTPFVNVFDNY
ncbi:MAG: energy-coupling factor transporter transmembrane component T [Sporolactobacillus sp.]